MGETTRRVLILDDERAICKTLEEFFRARGFVAASAFSGEEALTRLKEGPVDLVLIDILLPGIHGLEVLRHVKQLHPQARVAIITGLEDPELRAKAKTVGADAYITKPFNFSDPVWASLTASAPTP